MKIKSPLGLAAAIGCAGCVILTLCFGPYWPATPWAVLPRDQAIAKARDLAKQFGFDAYKSKAHIRASVSKPLAHYAQQHPNDSAARSLSPLTERITFGANKKAGVVGIDSAGAPTYWSAPEDFKSTKPAATEKDAAQQALQLMSGSSAGLFSDSSRSMGEDPKDEDYVWKKHLPEHSETRERITATIENTQIKLAERKLTIADDEADSETGDNHTYWTILAAIFWTICTAACVVATGIYVLWLVRRSMSQRFPLIAAGVAFVLIMAARLFAEDDVSVGSAIFMALLMMCFVAVGRGIWKDARPKWMALEQLCWLAPLAKATGESLAAGVLCSPMLVAIPYLIAACGLLPRSTVVAQNLKILYSPFPLLDSVNIPNTIYALGFFGFGMPVLGRMFRRRWLRWAIALPLGTVFFANAERVVTGPFAAPITAGFCTLALFGFLYKYFDLLAVLTLQLTSGIVLAWLMVVHKGAASGGPFFMALGVLLLAGYVIAQKGQTAVHGDPRAVAPALEGFRGEREKLQAEFSVARRAQQGMLPQAPPVIPGYSIAASCTPSLEVGGDLYDFLELPDGRIGIGVADVSGKGVPAALYMTLTKGLLASVSRDNSELADVVEEVNRHLHGVTRKKVFVTMALGFLDAEKRLLHCVRAGHNPMVWRQVWKDATTLVAPAGLGLGITAGKVFGKQLKVEEMALEEGDAVVFYSDGITEAMNNRLEQFGEERLMNVVAQTAHMDAAATHDSILTAVREFLGGVHPQDDMTLVVLRVGDERMLVSG